MWHLARSVTGKEDLEKSENCVCEYFALVERQRYT